MRSIILAPQSRGFAHKSIDEAPDGWVLRLNEPTRNLEQNAKLWALLAEVSRQVDWYGTKLSTEEWKDVFTAALKKSKVVPGLDGGFVVLGQRTSHMSKAEFSELIELITAFCAEHNVKHDSQIKESTE
jgi:NinB protein